MNEREEFSKWCRNVWDLPQDLSKYLITLWEDNDWQGFDRAPMDDGFRALIEYLEDHNVIGPRTAETIMTWPGLANDGGDEEREEPRSRRAPPASTFRRERDRSGRRLEYGIPITRAAPRNPLGAKHHSSMPKIDRRIVIGGALLLVTLIVLGLVFALRGNQPNSVTVMTPLPPRIAVPTAIPAPTAIPVPTMSWDVGSVRAITPVEQSALRLGVITPADGVLFFMMLMMSLALVGNIVLDWEEGSEASGDQRWEKIIVAGQSSCGLVAGLLSGLVIAWTAKSNIGFLFGFAVLSAIWAIAAIRIAKDGSPLNAALVLAAAALAIRGVTELPVGFGLGEAWVGFYNVSSLVTLVSGMRFDAAALTLLVYVLLIAAVVVASIEALRKYEPSQAGLAAVLVIGAIVLGQLVGGWVVVRFFDMSTPDKVLAAQMAKPILGWVLGVVLSLGALLLSRGRKVSVRNTTVQIAEISGPQGVVNFIMLITTASVVINLLAR